MTQSHLDKNIHHQTSSSNKEMMMMENPKPPPITPTYHRPCFFLLRWSSFQIQCTSR
ncbi:hypothetical protein LINPERHAP1_LOCUS25117 [Linum perenne]